MRRFCRTFLSMLIVAIASISCNVIQGDLELLVDEPNSIRFPQWSQDGSSIYYMLTSVGHSSSGYLWKFDLETGEKQGLSSDTITIYRFDLSLDDSEICFSKNITWLYFLQTQDGQLSDSISIDSIMTFTSPQYSPQDPNVIYYLSMKGDSLSLHRLNRDASSDKIIIQIPDTDNTPDFKVSCDESKVVIGNSVYTLNGELIKQLDREFEVDDWHPTDPNSFMGTEYEWLYFYDLDEDKWTKAKVSPYKSTLNGDARFSPDGSQIVLTSSSEGGFVDCALWLFEPLH